VDCIFCPSSAVCPSHCCEERRALHDADIEVDVHGVQNFYLVRWTENFDFIDLFISVSEHSLIYID
jgi:hypothetical protein